ncbi:uncharacterized [Tachysurus ichikawai]
MDNSNEQKGVGLGFTKSWSRGEEYESSRDAGELKHQKTLSKLSPFLACVPLEVVITAEMADRKEMNAAGLHFLFTSVMLKPWWSSIWIWKFTLISQCSSS